MIKSISIAALTVLLASSSGGTLAQTASPNGTDPSPLPQAAPAAKENPPQPIDGQIIVQDKNTYLASTLIGSWVLSPDNTAVGDVNDVIITPSGEVTGIVVGVGGFMGLGEKPVAVAMNRLKIAPGGDYSSAKIVLNVSLAELEAAPEFKSAMAQQLDEEMTRQALREPNIMNQVPQTTPPVPSQ